MTSRSVCRHIGGLTAGVRRLVSSPVAPSNGLFRPIYTAQRRAQLGPGAFSWRGLANTTSNTRAPHVASLRQPTAPTSSVLERDPSDHLPSLPVPNLNKTLERLKETIWPVAMNSDEFARALHLIDAFAGSPGQKLDLLLRAKASQTKNWLSHDWWLEEAYLKSRQSLVINSNPALIYPPLPFEVRDQRQLVAFCARLISSIIDCKLALQRGWNPEQDGSGSGMAADPSKQQLGSTLCSDQYRRIFGSTRVPGEQTDRFKAHESHENELHFNLVCSFRGQFFEINFEDVSSEQGRVEALESVLSKIIGARLEPSEKLEGAGILTSLRRDLWAQSIKLMEPGALEAIERAHLMLSLDTIASEPRDAFAKALVKGQGDGQGERAAADAGRRHLGALARQVLHADSANVGNRWFDKSLQLVVVADGDCSRLLGAGINYEHCIGEAVVLTRLIEFSYNKVIELHRGRQSSVTSGSSRADSVATFKRLKMLRDEGPNGALLADRMQQARRDFASQIEQFDLNYFHYKNYGRETIKSWRFSPDSWFQVALQLAHYQLHRRLGPCYESASTRQFAYGRTETIRSLTKDVAQFCFEPNYGSLRAAVDSHKGYAMAANCGSAIDRVLLGYRLTFNELKANQWAWGLPTFAPKEGDSSKRRLKFNSLADTQREQQVGLNDLFTEEELNTLSAFFNNKLFERAKRFSLSTSQVTSLEHPSICTSYGPMVPDGYACCYNLSEHQIVAAITANSSNQSFSCEAGKFSESLRASLDRMRDIAVEGQQQQGGRNEQRQQQEQRR